MDEKAKKKYKIFVNINGSTFTYNVDDYEIDENGLLKIFDTRIQDYRRFDPRVCEIQGGGKQEVEADGSD